jgi:hyperosmotically inducible periplasmic protein
MKTKYSVALIAAIITPLLCGPARAGSDNDDRIVTAAKQSYVYRTYLKDDDLKLEAKDGVVTLKGKVATTTHSAMAQDTVENLPGVRSVDNQLVVNPVQEHSDGWVELKVKSALLYRRSVSGTKITVSVRDAMVTLGGTASSQAEKELAEEYAKDIEGVKGVKNEIKVVVSPPSRSVREVIDDASITAQVKAALLTHRSTSALKTKVGTKNGEVTINGEAANQAEKDLVTKLANDIHGAKNVVNNMSVKQ